MSLTSLEKQNNLIISDCLKITTILEFVAIHLLILDDNNNYTKAWSVPCATISMIQKKKLLATSTAAIPYAKNVSWWSMKRRDF
jgi:hypothetical protein